MIDVKFIFYPIYDTFDSINPLDGMEHIFFFYFFCRFVLNTFKWRSVLKSESEQSYYMSYLTFIPSPHNLKFVIGTAFLLFKGATTWTGASLHIFPHRSYRLSDRSPLLVFTYTSGPRAADSNALRFYRSPLCTALYSYDTWYTVTDSFCTPCEPKYTSAVTVQINAWDINFPLSSFTCKFTGNDN